MGSGRLVAPQDDLFRNPSWLAVYLGQGMVPEHYDAMTELRADTVDPTGQLRRLRELMRAAAQTFPTHDAVLTRFAPAS